MKKLQRILHVSFDLTVSGGWKRSVVLMLGIAAFFVLAAFVLAARLGSAPQYKYLADAVSFRTAEKDHCGWTQASDDETELGPELQSIFLSLLARREASEAAAMQQSSPSFVLSRTDCVARLRLMHSANIFAELEVQTKKFTFETAEDGSFAGDFERNAETRRVRYSKSRDGWTITTVLIDDESIEPVLASGKLATDTRYMGFNYYPVDAPWDLFWIEFPVAQIDADFELISELGGNSIRIFLHHGQFSDPAFSETAIERLTILLDLAHKHGLKVIVTSFDLGVDYTPALWSENWQTLSSILRSASDHPAFLLLDLKNEADLDDGAWSRAIIDGFLLANITNIRADFPNVQITIGWSDAEHALRLAEYLDVVSYHDYRDPDGMGERLRAIETAVPDKLVLITEVGETSWHPMSISPRRQALRLDRRLKALAAADGVFLWTLHDFRHVPSSVVGWKPWRRRQQSLYGIIDQNGNPKPALEVVRDFFHSSLKHTTPNPETTEEEI